MKAEITIKNGYSFIQLTPDNEFEKTLIENADTMKYKNQLDVAVDFNYRSGYSDGQHKIMITFKEQENK